MISYFYSNIIRNITVALLEKFTGLQVHRYAEDQVTVVKVINVPIMFAPVSKIYLDRTEDYSAEPESSGKRYYQQIPRIALNLNSIAYDPSRAYGVNENRYFRNTTAED